MFFFSLVRLLLCAGGWGAAPVGQLQAWPLCAYSVWGSWSLLEMATLWNRLWTWCTVQWKIELTIYPSRYGGAACWWGLRLHWWRITWWITLRILLIQRSWVLFFLNIYIGACVCLTFTCQHVKHLSLNLRSSAKRLNLHNSICSFGWGMRSPSSVLWPSSQGGICKGIWESVSCGAVLICGSEVRTFVFLGFFVFFPPAFKSKMMCVFR